MNSLGYSTQNGNSSEKKMRFRLWSEGPNFDTELPQDVSGVEGQAVNLTCRLFYRDQKMVISHNRVRVTLILRFMRALQLNSRWILSGNNEHNLYDSRSILKLKYIKQNNKQVSFICRQFF